jgi:hypothetical protein
MLPAAYVFCEHLPQTASGKADRSALRLPTALEEFGGAFEPPRDEVEARVAAAFEQVLKKSPVGRRDDFFLCGGDSLSVMELHVHLVNGFGSEVPAAFEDTTVAGIAAAVRGKAQVPLDRSRLMPVLLPRRTSGTAPILFLVHGRRGQAHVGPRFLELLGEDQPLYVFQARGVDGVQRPHRTILAMARDYIAAMRSVQARGPYFLAGLCSGGFVTIRMAQLLRNAGEQVGPLILIDPPVPPFTAEGARQNLRALDSGLRSLQRKRNIEMDFSDPDRRRGAHDVAVAFERALLQYRALTYEGPVFLLASKEKLTATGWGDADRLRAHFSGDVRCFDVATRHTEILDTSNESFARHLADCARTARAAIVQLGIPPPGPE